MTTTPRRLFAALLALLLAGEASAQTREQVIGVSMLATVMRPPGEQRRPLAIINHGSPATAWQRPEMDLPRYEPLSSWFVERGYVVVLPLRRGYGDTGGGWAEGYGDCDEPDYYTAGLHGAEDIQAALDVMRKQRYVLPDRSIVVGHSAGGWATLALSSRNPRGVAGMINVAGGRGGRQTIGDGRIGNCKPGELVKAAGWYGETARLPVLWIYAANDTFFSPALARRMVDAYNKAGGNGTYRPLGEFDGNGHTFVGDEDGVAFWEKPVSRFLDSLK
ncbi:alpha/beta hydrolase family protein [Reyranella soli]|uniref:Dienelactone hydrolase n=1 Tax=Reyranella soli TaxID=1230389 RepID=A0A512NK09_9HYPH|nr:prolyl oligopeptidase family serine peptidase [Reyranella soli]GEP59265.1 dienelactone hydrolase [Reyranella soli]